MSDKNILIVIPARYQSSRLPGKPLVKIKGVEMIKRVAQIAAFVRKNNANASYCVATDDNRIEDFCKTQNIPVMMTSENCKSGTERCFEVACAKTPDFVINLQGDNPLCPPHIIQQLIDAWKTSEGDVFTPCVHLSWNEYDRFVEAKKTTPASGTSVLTDKNGYAVAFSKNIVPMIRKPEKAREKFPLSPVRRHIGLYAYTFEALKNYFSMEKSVYEDDCIEGLEQMRFIYNGARVKAVEVDYGDRKTTSGVDSPEDVARVEAIIEEFGELIKE